MSYSVYGMAYSVWRERRIEWYLPSLELSSPIDLNLHMSSQKCANRGFIGQFNGYWG